MLAGVSAPSPHDGNPLATLPEDPLPFFGRWLDQAVAALGPQNPTAMALATVDPDGRPAARMVICRGFDPEQGWLVFYTDRSSRKGLDLAAHPRAALVFYWEELQRQVRIEGPVTPAPDAQADAYFEARPLGAKLAAWTSDQSQPIGSRGELVDRFEATRERFGIDAAAPLDTPRPGSVARPPRWGGYRVWVERIEFWIGQPSRLHDRALFERVLAPAPDGFSGGAWRATRLRP